MESTFLSGRDISSPLYIVIPASALLINMFHELLNSKFTLSTLDTFL